MSYRSSFFRPTRRATTLLLGAVVLSAAAACSRESAEARQGGGPGGRGSQSVVLSATDVGVVRRDTVESAVPVTGDLLPIEHVDVKARLEGDLEGVYVREGDRVSRGQLLARFESSEQASNRASAEADRVAAQSDLSTAQWNYTQSQDLFKAGAIPERDLRTAEQAVAAARARLAAAQARLRSTTISAQDTRVLATTDGVIEKRLVEPGEHVARGAAMLTLVRNDVLELSAAVPARLAGDIRAGQRVHFVADGRPFEGKVARVSPTVDLASRAVQVYVQVPNPTGTLKGNTFASGRVVGRTAAGVLTVPTAALRQRQEDGQPYVYRIEGKRLAIAPLTLGIVDEARGLAEVLEGLAAGDRVVVGNVGTLGPGMPVQILGEQDRTANARPVPGGRAAGQSK